MRRCAGSLRSLRLGAPDGALRLDNAFGLHPSLAFLHERHLGGELIVFDAVASPYRDRSHFDGQNVLENGLTKPIGSADGWLNRALAALPGRGAAGGRAVAISQNVPLILRGEVVVSSKSPQSLPEVDEELLTRLADLYSKDEWLAARLSEAVQMDKPFAVTRRRAWQGQRPALRGRLPRWRVSAATPDAQRRRS